MTVACASGITVEVILCKYSRHSTALCQHAQVEFAKKHAVRCNVLVFVKPKTATITYTAVALMMTGWDVRLHEQTPDY